MPTINDTSGTVYLFRHASSIASEDEGDEDRVVYRQKRNTPLGPHGIEQARKTGLFIRSWAKEPDILYCSDYLRAKQTAQIIAEHSRTLFPNIDPLYGEIRRRVDGEPRGGFLDTEYRRQRGLAIQHHDLDWRFDPGDESFREALQRANLAKHQLEQNHHGESVAIVGHSQAHIFLMASMLLGDKPSPTDFFRFFNRHFMKHCAISKLTKSKGKWQMLAEDFNYTSHLKPTNL